jgi:alpha-D-ribose 1-methylphosphonate 5-triphosphate synthase subunit PhnH
MRRDTTFRETCFDPLFAGSAISRCLLDAISRPGAVLPLGEIPLVVPPPDLRPACAVLLAVLDRDVTFHVADPGASEIRDYLRFNTGARPFPPEQADFVLVIGRSAGAALDAIVGAMPGRGDDGVRIVYAPTELGPRETGAEVVLALGVANGVGERCLSLSGVAAADFHRLGAHRLTSRSVDLWFASADGRLAAIPRSTWWCAAS